MAEVEAARRHAEEQVPEPDQVSVRNVVLVGVIWAVVVALLMGWLGLLISWYRPDLPPGHEFSALEKAPMVPPEPRLQANPYVDIDRLHAREADVLGHYGWVDRAGGIARIPIDEAMRRIAGQPLDPPGAKP